MSRTTLSTRRSFIQTAGVAVSAPLAAVAATEPVRASTAGQSLAARLALLEDRDAIRALNEEYARLVNAGLRDSVAALFSDRSAVQLDPQISGLAPAGFGEHDRIEIAADRTSATALLQCVVTREQAIGPSCTLVDMARAQGGGVVRRTERATVENHYVRQDGTWRIVRSTYRALD